MGRPKKSPLMDNEDVKALFAILKENGRDTSVLTAIIKSVTLMEQQLNKAVAGFDAVQKELSTMREERDHPIKTLLEKTARSLSAKVKGLRERIKAIKDGIVNGCKRAVAAFKNNGISALNNLAGFFDVKQMLVSERDGINGCIKEAQASIAKIENAAEQYHTAGRALKNLGRAVRGQEPIPDIKPNGNLARLLEAPFRSDLSHLNRSLRSVNKALASIDRLEKAAAKIAEADRPSTLENMERLQKGIDAERDAPGRARTRSKRKEAEI